MLRPASGFIVVAFGAVSMLLAVPVTSQAQPPSPPPTATAPKPAPTATPPAPTGQIHRVGSTFAVNGGSPLGLSGSGALIVGRVQTGGDSCPSATGTLLQAEAGVGGGKVSLGRLLFTYCYTPFGSLGAADVKVSLLRTWGAPLWAPADQTYLGPEIDIGVADWKMSLGLLVRLGEESATKRLRFTWALGRGF